MRDDESRSACADRCEAMVPTEGEEPVSTILLASTTFLLGGAATVMLIATLVGAGNIPDWVLRMPWWMWILPSMLMAIAWARAQNNEKKRLQNEQRAWVSRLQSRAKESVEQETANCINQYNEAINASVRDQISTWTHDAIAASTVIVLENATIFRIDRPVPVLELAWLIACHSPVHCEITITGGVAVIYGVGTQERHLALITKSKTDVFDGNCIPDRPPIKRRTFTAALNSLSTGIYALSVEIEYNIAVDGLNRSFSIKYPDVLI